MASIFSGSVAGWWHEKLRRWRRAFFYSFDYYLFFSLSWFWSYFLKPCCCCWCCCCFYLAGLIRSIWLLSPSHPKKIHFCLSVHSSGCWRTNFHFLCSLNLKLIPSIQRDADIFWGRTTQSFWNRLSVGSIVAKVRWMW